MLLIALNMTEKQSTKLKKILMLTNFLMRWCNLMLKWQKHFTIMPLLTQDWVELEKQVQLVNF